MFSLLAAALVALVGTPAAQAAMRGCRADPVFLLSDGTVLDVTVDIGTDVSNVKTIQYVVHGPRGTRLVSALSTPTIGFQGLETVSYVADQHSNKYVTDTLVTTTVPKVSVAAYTTFAANTVNLSWSSVQLGLSAQYQVIEGLAGQHLIAYLKK